LESALPLPPTHLNGTAHRIWPASFKNGTLDNLHSVAQIGPNMTLKTHIHYKKFYTSRKISAIDVRSVQKLGHSGWSGCTLFAYVPMSVFA